MGIRGKKNYKVRTGARTTSKGLEKELKRKAKRLAQDPTLALPRCTVDVPLIKKLEKKLREVQSHKDNRSALEKLSKKGDRFVRAYAATLLLIHEDKIPYIAVFRGPFGDVGYALRGQTSKEKLVGIQHYDDPRIKMMAFLEEVKKGKLFMFVTENELICTGSVPKPPDEVLDLLPKRLGKGMIGGDSLIYSKDLEKKVVAKMEPWKEPYIVVHWLSAGMDIAKSLYHSRMNKDNTFATCASYMATSNISDYFDVDVIVKPVCKRGVGCGCDLPPKKEEKGSFLSRLGKVKEPTSKEQYLQGKVMDHRFIEKEYQEYLERLREEGKTVYIVENRCYGDSRKDLISSLRLSTEELEVMKVFLEFARGPLISMDPSANKIMTPFWDEVGKDLIDRIIDNKKIAKKVFKELPVPRFQPMAVIQEGKFQIQEQKVRGMLPHLVDPPEMMDFAYECTIAYLVRGRNGASRIIERYQGDDIKLKAAKYAFVKHLDLEKKAGWSYTTHEIGYAEGLDEIVGRITVEDPDKFISGMKELWKATGSTTDLKFR